MVGSFLSDFKLTTPGFKICVSLCAVALFVILVYSNSFSVGMYVDDEKEIAMNPLVQSFSGLVPLFEQYHMRTLSYLTFVASWALHGYTPEYYHIINLVLHIATGMLLYWLILLTCRTPVYTRIQPVRYPYRIAVFGLLIFLLHPLQTSSVTYILQRIVLLAAFNSMATVCFYSAARLYRIAREKRAMWYCYVASLFFFVAGCFSKESVLTLPVVLFVYEYIFFSQSSPNKKRVKKLVCILALGVLGLCVLSVYRSEFPYFLQGVGVSAGAYVLNQGQVFAQYMQLLLYPLEQSVEHQIVLTKTLFHLETLLGFSCVLGLIVSMCVSLRRYPFYAFGAFLLTWQLFFIPLFSPVKNLIEEPHMYMAISGFAIIVAPLLIQWHSRRRSKVIVLLCFFMLVQYAALSYMRNEVWQSPYSLWNDAITKSPQSARAYMGRGRALLDAGEGERALADYHHALRIYPHYVAAHYNIGLLYSHNKDYARALNHFSYALRLPRGSVQPEFVFVDRGILYEKMGKYALAEIDFQNALTENPRFYPAYFNRGLMCLAQGNYQKAVEAFTETIKGAPFLAHAYYQRGIAYMKLGTPAEAQSDFSHVRSLGYYVDNNGMEYVPQV